MRAQRQEMKLLIEGGADEADLINLRARYRVTSQEYVRFSEAAGLPQQRERVSIDGRGARAGNLPPNAAPAALGGGHVTGTVSDQERAELLEHPRMALTSGAQSGIINRKVSDRMINSNNESDYGVFDFEDIERDLESSSVGRDIAPYIEDEGIYIMMNYDVNLPEEGLAGYIRGKNVEIYAVLHNNETEVSQTIIHECAHRKYHWDEDMEGEINCRLLEHFHSHETISEKEIQAIVDFVVRSILNFRRGICMATNQVDIVKRLRSGEKVLCPCCGKGYMAGMTKRPPERETHFVCPECKEKLILNFRMKTA